MVAVPAQGRPRGKPPFSPRGGAPLEASPLPRLVRMAFLATKAAKRVIEQHAKQFEPQDPFYEFWTDKNGNKKRRKVGVADERGNGPS